MLLEFRTSNYKSFKDEVVFSMEPVSDQEDLEYSLLNGLGGGDVYQGLSSAVIYGPNASGKTNIIGAMDAFKTIVLRGHLRNGDSRNSPNAASNLLELIPNCSSPDIHPVTFAIKFIADNLLIEYAFSADLGEFLDTEYQRKILNETLKINNNMMFSRQERLKFGLFDSMKEYFTDALEKNKQSAELLAESNLKEDELFLTNGFKAIFSASLVSLVTSWLENEFMVVYRADAMHLTKRFKGASKDAVYVAKELNGVASQIGLASNGLAYKIKDENDNRAELCSLVGNSKKQVAISAEAFESLGTIRFVNLFPLIADTLMNGGVLIVDEFDASIHPMVIMNIINIFHNNEINKNQAQLIFNTHNPIFLNANLYRRDEIRFVEKDEISRCSSCYSLAEFDDVRKGEDYMKNYFIGRYGATIDIDFSPRFKSLWEDEEE